MRKTQPYLLTVAWTREGSARAQLELREIISDGDEVLAERSVAAQGIPIPLSEEILGQVNSGLIAAGAEKDAEIAAQRETIKAMESEVARLQFELSKPRG